MYIVYSKPNCAQCEQAKQMLSDRGLIYTEKVFDVGQKKVDGVIYVNVSEFKTQFPQAKTAPQIFQEYNDEIRHIGGFTELRLKLANLN